MKQALFDEWLSALRSGNWRQGRYTMETADGHFCCLGVLARVDRWTGVKRVKTPEGPIRYLYKKGYSDICPNEEYRAALGLDPVTMNKVIDMNDCLGGTFRDIANYLEERRDEIVGKEQA